LQNTDIQNEDHFTARITLLYCLNGFAQETASVTEKTETVETFDTFYDTIKSKKRVILK
jgi:hypothetical protein